MVNMKFIFMVSFIALFATGAAFAAAGDQSTGVGIAAVSYVDRIVAEKVDDLATVATSGSYNDLSDKPNIPTVNNATLTIQQNGTDVATFTANSSSGATANITVPTKVSDLTNDSNYATKSELPTVNNATLTIQKNGSTVGKFTANSSSDSVISIEVPTGTLASKNTITNADVAENAAITQDKIYGLQTVLGRKEDTANKLTAADTTTVVNDNNKDILYPSVGRVEAMIPTVNNGTLNIVNGATGIRIARFDANQSGVSEATIPAATAEVAGLAKLYNVASNANDGAMSAKAVSAQLATKLDASEYKYGYIPTNSSGEGEALIWVE